MGGVKINVITNHLISHGSNILRDIDLHKGGTHHSKQSKSTLYDYVQSKESKNIPALRSV